MDIAGGKNAAVVEVGPALYGRLGVVPRDMCTGGGLEEKLDGCNIEMSARCRMEAVVEARGVIGSLSTNMCFFRFCSFSFRNATFY